MKDHNGKYVNGNGTLRRNGHVFRSPETQILFHQARLNAAKQKRYYWRKKDGTSPLQVTLNKNELVQELINNGLLDPYQFENIAAVQRATERLIELALDQMNFERYVAQYPWQKDQPDAFKLFLDSEFSSIGRKIRNGRWQD